MNILACWTTAIFDSLVTLTATVRLEDGGNLRFLVEGRGEVIYVPCKASKLALRSTSLFFYLVGTEVKAARL
jgi:hypothetical protein